MTKSYNKSQRDFARELSKLGELLSKKYPKELEEINNKCHKIDCWITEWYKRKGFIEYKVENGECNMYLKLK